jgi:hypothetical protein
MTPGQGVHRDDAPLKRGGRSDDTLRGMNVYEIKRRVEHADYEVDPVLVTEAMLRHALSYRRWWNPRMEHLAPPETRFTRSGPVVTRPTHVTPTASAPARAGSGTQTHSS